MPTSLGVNLGTAFQWSFTAVVGQTTVGIDAACLPATGGLVAARATGSIIEVMPGPLAHSSTTVAANTHHPELLALHCQGAGITVTLTVQVLPAQ